MAKPENNRAWLFMAPALLLLGGVAGVPLVMVMDYSLHDIFALDAKVWVGLEWYCDILGASRFWDSFARSLLFTAIVLIVEIPLGIVLAVHMPQQGRWVGVCLVAMSLPLVVPWNMIAMIWTVFLSPDFMGGLLVHLGFSALWNLSAVQTWVAIVLMDVWHWTSLVVLLCYSSLTTIHPAFYQAAAIDGASRWNVFRYVELPKMRGVLTMALLLRFIDSFMVYTEPFRLNAGGPRSSTTFLAMELGKDIAAQDYSPASARAVIYFLIILAISRVFKTVIAVYESDSKFSKKSRVGTE